MELARTKWIRRASNRDLGAYDVFEAEGDLPDPVWPAAPFQELLRVAFRNRLVAEADHPVLRRLRGKI